MGCVDACYWYPVFTDLETEIASPTKSFPFGTQQHGTMLSISSKMPLRMSY
jgi:hypothetical protein